MKTYLFGWRHCFLGVYDGREWIVLNNMDVMLFARAGANWKSK